MTQPSRNPLLGYNHNVKYGGKIFHVQTEDSGPSNPHVFTHLFFEGSILASKRAQYDPSLEEDDVRDLMQKQHKAILKELKNAEINERIARFFDMRGETFPLEPIFPDTPLPLPITPPPLVEGKTEEAPESSSPPSVARATVPKPPEVKPGPPMTLDLDAVQGQNELHRIPLPLPVHRKPPLVPGPGAYTFRRPSTRDKLPAVEMAVPHRAKSQVTPPPPAANAKPAHKPAPARSATPHPGAGVVVQRQVSVGHGGKGAPGPQKPTPVRRRHSPGNPYVVSNGTIPILVPHQALEASLREAAKASSSAGNPPSAKTPAAEEPKKKDSLDEAILAYLHGDDKP